ncbi:hypothetical protein Q4I28_001342 [Leishmania naiffi]|uniref:Uncharacterized protein n=1 Tax=Leishmania naiffi TaxID=5678 RepID=A0AAW3C462_9TRYP
MASCRTGRLPMPDDPLFNPTHIHGLRHSSRLAGLGMIAVIWIMYEKLRHSHHYITYKGPENPFARIRHRRFPGGAFMFGWGNNGLNRDCGIKEFECWAGYTGKEYTY